MLNSLVKVVLPKEAADLIIEAIQVVIANFRLQLQNRPDFLALAVKSGYSTDNHFMVLADTCVEIESQLEGNAEEPEISLLSSQWEVSALCALIISRCLEDSETKSSDSIATSVTLKILADEIISNLKYSQQVVNIRRQQTQLE